MEFKSFKCLLVATLLFSLIVASDAFGETWKITSLNWQPYSGAEMTNQGNSIQKLRLLLEKKGITLVVEFYPWKRAQFLAGKEEYAGYFPAWPEEVGEGFTGSSAVDTSVLGIMKRTGAKVDFDTVDSLFKNYKVGIVTTYVYPKSVEAAAKKYSSRTEKSKDEMTLLKKLSGGRFDVALTDPNVMMYLAGKEGISNIEPLDKIIENKPLVISFRKGADNQKRIDLMEEILKNK